jgi:hypothetical protein
MTYGTSNLARRFCNALCWCVFAIPFLVRAWDTAPYIPPIGKPFQVSVDTNNILPTSAYVLGSSNFADSGIMFSTNTAPDVFVDPDTGNQTFSILSNSLTDGLSFQQKLNLYFISNPLFWYATNILVPSEYQLYQNYQGDVYQEPGVGIYYTTFNYISQNLGSISFQSWLCISNIFGQTNVVPFIDLNIGFFSSGYSSLTNVDLSGYFRLGSYLPPLAVLMSPTNILNIANFSFVCTNVVQYYYVTNTYFVGYPISNLDDVNFSDEVLAGVEIQTSNSTPNTHLFGPYTAFGSSSQYSPVYYTTDAFTLYPTPGDCYVGQGSVVSNSTSLNYRYTSVLMQDQSAWTPFTNGVGE